jgi:hypothetical protein
VLVAQPTVIATAARLVTVTPARKAIRINPKHVSKDETFRAFRLSLPLVTEGLLIDRLLLAILEAYRLTQMRRFALA